MMFAASLILLASLALASPLVKRVEDYVDPRIDGGSMLDASAGLGEPLNVIVSANSAPEVLTEDGFLEYSRAVGFAEECLGLHLGNPQQANLGDGRGWVNETAVIRESLGDIPTWGTCLESFFGGNHFRLWTQQSTGALFLAASAEEWVGEDHNIIEDGYNIGRDLFVEGAVGTHSYTDEDTGITKTYTTMSQDIEGLLTAGSEGINHGIAIDGIVKLITVILDSVEGGDA